MSIGRGPGVRDSAEGLVRRQRLFGALERGTKRALTLVSGPAGSGKTLLVTSWLQEGFSPIQAAWVPVKRGEQDATRFWTAVGVVSFVRRAGPVVIVTSGRIVSMVSI